MRGGVHRCQGNLFVFVFGRTRAHFIMRFNIISSQIHYDVIKYHRRQCSIKLLFTAAARKNVPTPRNFNELIRVHRFYPFRMVPRKMAVAVERNKFHKCKFARRICEINKRSRESRRAKWRGDHSGVHKSDDVASQRVARGTFVA